MFRYYKHPYKYQKVKVDSFVLVALFSVNNSQQKHLAPVMPEVLKISTRLTCEVCLKQFSSKSKHMVRHREERKYKCEEYNKSFAHGGI